ncbi:hypothetical protein PAECIP111802_07115 [Paenibacillus allorhizosphaerae]|uniref:Uncharacterized protein n=2 Tax=Paenibacillus allorhizosphaerae TaxID=2849866 RepID=A0ABM8VUA9_9BACL|nr:hypothetical protein PAECIP111802_07115 [Paenibacillus allorhizosphaerae]
MADNNYISHQSSLINVYSEVEKLALICRNLLLRHRVSQDNKRIVKITEYLDLIIEKERLVLSELFHKIR